MMLWHKKVTNDIKSNNIQRDIDKHVFNNLNFGDYFKRRLFNNKGLNYNIEQELTEVV